MPDDIQIKKHSVCISGHSTSITIEDDFWRILKKIAHKKGMSVNALISDIDEQNQGNLSSAVRIHILKYLEERLAQQSL